ncbi:MAG: HAD-IIIC family phosphatase [Rhodospirillales bacterium]
MTSSLFWLPEPPKDYKARIGAVGKADAASFDGALTALGQYRLSDRDAARLCRAVAESGIAPSFPAKSLFVLSDSTTDYLPHNLTAAGYRYGVALDVAAAPFGQVQLALASSRTAIGSTDIVLVALTHFSFAADASLAALDDVALAKATEDLSSLVDDCLAAGAKSVMVQTVPLPVGGRFGSIDRRTPGSERWFLNRLNENILELAGRPGVMVADIDALASEIGLGNWHDARGRGLAKLPFDSRYLPDYADRIARLVGASAGRSRKLLVLDLDNTIWGGVIGDDGIDGIRLGPDDALGEAYLAVQRAALALRDRGVVLAVCSKNDAATVREAFDTHPYMVLKQDHFVEIRANWDDKAENIVHICEALNFGLDAAVFLDDNPAERERVRESLPGVAVLEFPAEPAVIADTLRCCGYFETTSVTREDKERAGMYAADAERAQALSVSRSADDFLRGLGMAFQIDDVLDDRFAQLLNKTNQFNLTLKRLAAGEIDDLQRSADTIVVGGKLRDKFGEQGKITAVVARIEGDLGHIENWTMSCRVLGRGVERAVLNVLVDRARDRGVRTLVGRYVPGPRNALVEDHYRNLGFQDAGDGTWHLSVEAFTPLEHFIDMVR